MRKFLAACYRVLKSPWTLLIFALSVLGISLLGCYNLGVDFRIESWSTGVIFGLGLECFGDAVAQLLPPPEKDK